MPLAVSSRLSVHGCWQVTHHPGRLVLWLGSLRAVAWVVSVAYVAFVAGVKGLRLLRAVSPKPGLPGAVAGVKAAAAVTLAPMVTCLTVGMFGVANSTCDDSSRVDCDRHAAVGKMSFQGKASAEHPGL